MFTKSHRRPAAIVMALGLASSSCRDAITNVAPVEPAESLKTRGAPGQGRLLVSCTFSERTPDGPHRYRYGFLHFAVPKEVFRPDKGLLRYHVRFQDPGQEPVYSADCLIPNTPEAIAFMDKHVAQGKGHRVEGSSGGDGSTGGGLRPSTASADILPYIQVLPGMTVVAAADGYAGLGGINFGECTNWCYDSSQVDTGGGWYPEPEQTLSCDPQTDPTCNQPLTTTDSANIIKAFRDFVKDPQTIADTLVRRECQEMIDKFNQMAAEGRVYRGGSNTRPEDAMDEHYAAWDPVTNTMHYDPMWLDSASTGDPKYIRSLANSSLHEAAHALGYNHSPAVAGLYAEEPFNRLSMGDRSCLSGSAF